jgi:hypothetical protein
LWNIFRLAERNPPIVVFPDRGPADSGTMNLIARLFGWLWGAETVAPTQDEDRSSMADLVRLLNSDDPPSDGDAGSSDRTPLSSE